MQATVLKNQTFCCCRFDGCNQKVFVSRERPPGTQFSQELNPKPNPTTSRTTPTITPLIAVDTRFTQGEINVMAFTALLFIMLILVSIGGFLYYKRRRLRRLKSLMPSVRYSKTTSSEDFDVANNGKLVF